jgi:putative ABC transport system ATP-binding protein
MGTVAIQAEGLTKWFGEGESKTYAVRGASFEARFQEMLYIVAPSGSGKTTLLSMISGILRPDGGSVRVEDTDVWSLRDNALADFRLRKIGFVFQDYHPRHKHQDSTRVRAFAAVRLAEDSALKSAARASRLACAADYFSVPAARGRAAVPGRAGRRVHRGEVT